jgi:hypothetical protein
MTKQWKPQIGELYWVVYSNFALLWEMGIQWTNSDFDKALFKIGNVYRTRREAEQAKKRILKALKGE